jgi:arylsulfatase A-like enzyme
MQARRRPNILLLVADDQRADTIAALGNPHIHTPSLDTLAAQSAQFTRCYCMGGNNPAVCLPSRNMLLSGRAYTRYGRFAPGSEPNFPDALRANTYYTCHFGKRGNSAEEIQARFDSNNYLDEHELRRSADPGRIAADRAIAFLEQRPKDQPFFLYVAFEAPHDPRLPRPEDAARYAKTDLPLPPNFLPVHPFDNGEMTVRDELLAPWPRTESEIRRHLRDYYATITGLDRQVGRVLQSLEERGLANDTLVIYTSDQGLALGSHGLMGKQNLYEHSMRVPLLLRGPGVKPGPRDAMVYLTDLFPTVLDWLGLRLPATLDGFSFKTALQLPAARARGGIFTAYRDCQRAWRDDRYKLILYPRINRAQLFDLASDPDEKSDLSAQQPERVEAMKQLLRQAQQRFGDPFALESLKPQPAEWNPPSAEALQALRQQWRM